MAQPAASLLTEEAQNSLVMRFTRNPELIQKYKNLREELYQNDRRFVGFRIFNEEGAENYNDPDDQMLIIDDGEKCLGGACLRISTPNRPVILDLEKDIQPSPGQDHFLLKDALPGLQLDKFAYAEFNRIVLHPSLRKGLASRQIFQAVFDRCMESRVRYMFGIGDKVRTRLYLQIYGSVGFSGVRCDNIVIPMREEYEGLQMHLIYGDMKKFYTAEKDPETFLLSPKSDFKFE